MKSHLNADKEIIQRTRRKRRTRRTRKTRKTRRKKIPMQHSIKKDE
jgi:hypothetical protein